MGTQINGQSLWSREERQAAGVQEFSAEFCLGVLCLYLVVWRQNILKRGYILKGGTTKIRTESRRI